MTSPCTKPSTAMGQKIENEIRIDRTLLRDVGLESLADLDARLLLAATHEVLEARVGSRLVGLMSDVQLAEFQGLVGKNDEAAHAWLDREFPKHRRIVEEEWPRVTAELGEIAPEILQLVS